LILQERNQRYSRRKQRRAHREEHRTDNNREYRKEDGGNRGEKTVEKIKENIEEEMGEKKVNITAVCCQHSFIRLPTFVVEGRPSSLSLGSPCHPSKPSVSPNLGAVEATGLAPSPPLAQAVNVSCS
jgi:hypothetical protein